MGTTVENSDKNQLIERLLDLVCGPDDLAAREAKRKEWRGRSYEELKTLRKQHEE